jgi:uncharacterized protein (DUF1778 family)
MLYPSWCNESLIQTSSGCYILAITSTEVKSERIDVRTTRSAKALLQRAAGSLHRNVSAFLIDAGMAAAEGVLVDQRLFRLEEAEWLAFRDMLNRLVGTKPRFARLLSEKRVLDQWALVSGIPVSRSFARSTSLTTSTAARNHSTASSNALY